MDFQFLLPQKIIFKRNSAQNLGQIISGHYKKTLIITGSGSIVKSGIYEKIVNSMVLNKVEYIEYKGISGEPGPGLIDTVTDFSKDKNIDCVISIGGGSVIDTGKAVSALVVNEKGVENYLEGVGKNYQVKNEPLPFIAVPTTAGSGAEATKNSVITNREKKYKKSFRHESLVAKIIIADPVLTVSLPASQTAFVGMDAICQLVESYVSKKRNTYAMALSSYFIPYALNAIPECYKNPGNIDAREIMLQSSLSSGIALANSGLGAVHGFASGLGGMFDIPHGLICAVLLPHVCRLNAEKQPALYKELAEIVNPGRSGDIERLINMFYELNDKLNIPADFKQFSIPEECAAEIVERSFGSSMSGNPVDFTKEEWIEFINKFL